jgi:hypothetical protein
MQSLILRQSSTNDELMQSDIELLDDNWEKICFLKKTNSKTDKNWLQNYGMQQVSFRC